MLFIPAPCVYINVLVCTTVGCYPARIVYIWTRCVALADTTHVVRFDVCYAFVVVARAPIPGFLPGYLVVHILPAFRLLRLRCPVGAVNVMRSPTPVTDYVMVFRTLRCCPFCCAPVRYPTRLGVAVYGLPFATIAVYYPRLRFGAVGTAPGSRLPHYPCYPVTLQRYGSPCHSWTPLPPLPVRCVAPRLVWIAHAVAVALPALHRRLDRLDVCSPAFLHCAPVYLWFGYYVIVAFTARYPVVARVGYRGCLVARLIPVG